MVRSVWHFAVLGIMLTVSRGTTAGEPSAEVLLPVAEQKDAYTPNAAYGKNVFLVVWQSGRLAAGDLSQGVRGQSEIVGMRVDRDGKPLDAKPFVIGAGKNVRQSPRAAFGDGVFLVVWHDMRNGKDWDVFAARVTPDEKVLDPDSIPVATEARTQALPRVVWDGNNFAIVWQDYRSTDRYEVYGTTISSNGKVLSAKGQLLASAKDRHRFAPALASTGSGKSLLFWNGDNRQGTGTTAGCEWVVDGKLAGSVAMEGKSSKGGPGFGYVPMCLCSGPKTFLVAWTTDNALGRDGSPGDTNAAILDAHGKRTHSLLLGNKPQRIRDPELAWDGSAFVAVWHEGFRKDKKAGLADAVFTSRVSAAGEVSGLLHLAGAFRSPAAQACVASDGAGRSLIAYEKHPESGDVPIQVAFRLLTSERR